MSFSESVSDFIDPQEFADVATIAGQSVNGLFDHQYVEIQGNDSMKPTFYCALADVSGVGNGDALNVNSKAFKVVDVRPDSPFCLLVLHDG